MIKEKNQNYIFYTFLTLLAIFASLSCFHITFQIFIYIIVAITPLFFNDTKTISVYFFSACFMACFGHGMFLAILNISLFILEVKKLVFAIINKQNKKDIITILTVWISLLIILTIYSLIYNHFKIHRIGMFVDFIQCIVVLFLVRKNIDIKYILFTLLAGLISSVSLSLIFVICNYSNPFIIGFWGDRYGAFFNNVNGLSVYCTLGASSFIVLLLTDRLNFKKYFYIPFIFSLIGLLPYSKAFILVNVLLYSAWFVLSFLKSNNKKRFILYLTALIIGIVIIMFIARNYISTIIDRFSSSSQPSTLDSITTGRGKIWAKYFDRWLKSPLTFLFGNGYTASKIDTNQYEHSIYLAFLFQFGVIGTIVIISTLVWTIRKNSKLQKNVSCYIPLAILLINGLVSNLSGILCSCLIWFVALYFITVDSNESTSKPNSKNDSIDDNPLNSNIEKPKE